MHGRLHWTMCWCHHRMLSEGYDDMTFHTHTFSFVSFAAFLTCSTCLSLYREHRALAKKFKSNQWARLHQPYRSYSDLVSILSWRSRRPCSPWQSCWSWLSITPGRTDRPLLSLQNKWEKKISSECSYDILRWEVVFVYYNRLFHIFILLGFTSAICLIMTLLKARACIFYYPVVGSSAVLCDQRHIVYETKWAIFPKSYRFAFLSHRPSRTHTSWPSWLANAAGWPSRTPLSCGTLEMRGDREVMWWFTHWFHETLVINEMVVVIRRHGNSPPAS